MKAARVLAASVAAVGVLAIPGIAHAATITNPFHADSGDGCRYGSTDGTLSWRSGPTTSPLPFTSVAVKGKVSDRPLPIDPGPVCRDDGYNSTATFVAYSGSVIVDRRTQTVNNATIAFDFMLGANSTTSRSITKVTVQVCRSPVVTLPPSYCGALVSYPAPPTA